MDATFAALPKLDALGDDAVAAPEAGEGDFAAFEFCLELGHLVEQERAGVDDAGLVRDPGADLAFAGTGGVVLE